MMTTNELNAESDFPNLISPIVQLCLACIPELAKSKEIDPAIQ